MDQSPFMARLRELLEADDLAPATVARTLIDSDQFREYLEGSTGVPLDPQAPEVTSADLTDWRGHLQRLGLTAGTIQRKFASVRKALVLIGEARGKIRAALGDLAQTVDAKTMEEAVASAFALASRGEAVLLSPMCSSFDMFKNYSQRGAAFVEAVKGLGPCEKVNQGKQ